METTRQHAITTATMSRQRQHQQFNYHDNYTTKMYQQQRRRQQR